MFGLERSILENLIPKPASKRIPGNLGEPLRKVNDENDLVIEIFERDGSSFVNQVEVEKNDSQTIMRIFSVSDSDPLMYNSYRIDK